jgi:DNA-binding beta-propeller fold protein YncE
VRSRFAAIPEADGARALAVAGKGSVYVTLARTNRVLVLDHAGAVVGHVVNTGDPSVPLDVPAGIAIAGRRLLVSNQSTDNPAHWAVLSVSFSF